ncbi:MAG: ATP-binding protein, partial [Chloroflexota bacterium]
MTEPRDPAAPPRLSFRARLTMALIASAVVPLALFGLIVLVIGASFGDAAADGTVARGLLVFGIAVVAAVAIVTSYALSESLTAPLRSIAASVDRVSAGDLRTPIRVAGDDELARLADSHNRLAADLERRNRELGRILASIGEVSPRDGVETLVERTATDATTAFALIDAVVIMGDPANMEEEEVVPGVSRPLRAVLRAGGEDMGVLVGRLPATRRWERADQDLLELFASEMAAAIRNAQLFATVESQNQQLLELDAAKDDFLRGVSHNLQTPLTSIRAYAEQLDEASPDRRLGIIAEQSERLSRMVRQLLTVTRLESGALKPRSEVVALGTRVRKAWEALGQDDVAFTVDDQSGGWLAVADADQLDQVLWALLDNAVKYGGRAPVTVAIAVDEAGRTVRTTIRDGGPGVAADVRDRLFQRFARGAAPEHDGGSGLGLYV